MREFHAGTSAKVEEHPQAHALLRACAGAESNIQPIPEMMEEEIFK
jgi:hypothetical protein